MEHLQAPKYRAMRYIAVFGIAYRPGATLDNYVLWPLAHELAPLNEGAQRVADYYAKNKANRNLPPRPFETDIAHCFFLPAHLPDVGQHWRPEFRDVEDGPRYVSTGPINFADRSVDGRKPFPWLGWPGVYFKPANETAKRIVAYAADNAEHRLFRQMVSPWNDFTRAPHLPVLPVETNRRVPQVLTAHGMVDETGAFA